MLKEMLNHVREKCPLIHNITNYVTVNDCANILLACGGSPIMADDAEEAEEITAICGGLNINIGTLNQRTIPAMHLAGKKANELGHPVVLDPVGAGASKLRTNTAKALLEDIQKSLYEKALANREAHTYTAKSLDEMKSILAEHTGFIKSMWCGDLACEEKVKEETGMPSRCMPFEQEHIADTCPVCGKKADKMVVWGIAY